MLFFFYDGLLRKDNILTCKNALVLSLISTHITCFEWDINAYIVSFLMSTAIILSFIKGIS